MQYKIPSGQMEPAGQCVGSIAAAYAIRLARGGSAVLTRQQMRDSRSRGKGFSRPFRT